MKSFRLSLLASALLAATPLVSWVIASEAPAKPSLNAEELAALQKRLTPLEFQVTMMNGTEPPFKNKYWNNKAPGIYVCIISGKPLFSSKDKFDSGTGWPSFTKPLAPELIEEIDDTSHGMTRTEVRSVPGKSHLGHVFHDGPPPTGLRYCMNSAALRFVPVADLEKEGLGNLKTTFQ